MFAVYLKFNATWNAINYRERSDRFVQLLAGVNQASFCNNRDAFVQRYGNEIEGSRLCRYAFA